jgi:hypothetical protein
MAPILFTAPSSLSDLEMGVTASDLACSSPPDADLCVLLDFELPKERSNTSYYEQIS